MDGVLARFDWHTLKVASNRKRDILYEYVSRAVRCLWEDVHARAGLFRSARDAYGNLREPRRSEFKSPARLLPRRLDDAELLVNGSSSCESLPGASDQRVDASSKDCEDAAAVLSHCLPLSRLEGAASEAAAPIDEDLEDETQQEHSNTQQQVPAFQDYCMLRVFVSWPPPPPDCDPSLQQSWCALSLPCQTSSIL
jgi:hypothetical protein